MLETEIINRDLSRILSGQGHGDLLLITDAGFAIPKELEVADLSLDVNQPKVLTVLQTLKKAFSVEKIILADETRQHNPGYFEAITKVWGDIPVEIITHAELKAKSREVKAVIRTGDFTSFANVILVSGSGNRWYSEI
jgi:D-ribose pyranase